MVIRLYSGGLEGVDAYPVELEVDFVRQGLPGFTLVGLAEAAVREAKDRVFAALRACNFRLPPARITVNLAPAGRRKDGAAYDLPLALGLLAAAELIPLEKLQNLFLAGELSLSGALRPVSRVRPGHFGRKQGAAGDCGAARQPGRSRGSARPARFMPRKIWPAAPRFWPEPVSWNPLPPWP